MEENNNIKQKSIFELFIYNAMYNIFNVLFPLLTVPYLSRVLLADGVGKVNYARNIVAWFMIVASLGIPRYGVREVAKVKTDSKKLSKLFSELFVVNFFSTCFCLAFYFMLILNNGYFRNRIVLYFVSGIQLLLNIFNVDWFYQGMEKYSYITQRSFVVKVLSLILMFIFVKSPNDYVIYALIQSFAVGGNYLFNFYNLRKYVRFKFTNLNLKQHVYPIIILLSTTLSTTIYSLLDTTILGIFTTDTKVGYYSNCHKIILTVATMTASLGSVMLPRLAKTYSENNINEVRELANKALSIIITICIPIVLGLVVFSPEMVELVFGSDFYPCVLTLRIFAPLVLFSTIGNLYGTQLLMVFNKEKKLLLSVFIGAVLNLVMNIILVGNYQHNGVAIASVITEFIVMLVQIYFVCKIISIKFPIKQYKSLVIMNSVLLIWILMMKILFNNAIWNLVIGGLGGFIIYFIMGISLNNNGIVYIKGNLANVLKKLLNKRAF